MYKTPHVIYTLPNLDINSKLKRLMNVNHYLRLRKQSKKRILLKYQLQLRKIRYNKRILEFVEIEKT